MSSRKISVVVKNTASGEVIIPTLSLKLSSNVKELKQRIMGAVPNFSQLHSLFVDRDCERIELVNPKQAIHDTLLRDKSVIFVDVDVDKASDLQKKMVNKIRNSVLTRVKNGSCLEYHEQTKFRDDKEIALAMVTHGFPMTYMSERLCDDKEIALAMVMRGYSMARMSERLRDDKEIALAMATHGYSMLYTSGRLRDDKEIVLAYINHCYFPAQYMSHRISDDKDVALAIVRKFPMGIRYLSSRMKADSDVIKAAVSRDICALTVCRVLCDNAEFMMDIMKQNVATLRFASDRLKCDMDFVMAAVKQNGTALKFASFMLKHNADIVMAAVANNFTALKYMPRRMYIDNNVASCISSIHTQIKQSS